MKKINPRFSANMAMKIYSAGFLLLIGSLFYYQVINGDYYLSRARNNYIKTIPIPAKRGSIFDHNGVILAHDKAAFSISVIPYQIRHKKIALLRKISKFTGYDLEIIRKNYAKNKRSMFSPADIIIDLDKASALKLKEKFKDDIVISTRPKRYYNYPYQFTHILGYVKKANTFYAQLKKYGYKPLERVGISGVEQIYNSYLKGEGGGDLLEVNSIGNTVGFLGTQTPVKGKDIYLTVDSRIQNIAAKVMGNKPGAIILMDSYSGEIITLYSSPSFNLNNFIDGQGINELFSNKKSPLINRAIQATYPIGSIFKPILALAGLSENKIEPETSFNCDGSLSLGRSRFRCWSQHYKQNIFGAISQSCNVYFYNLGLILGPEIISKWGNKLGLMSITGIDLPNEKKGLIPSPEWKKNVYNQNWFAGDTLNFSIGQGFVQCSPLEILLAINVFANQGYLVTPYLLKSVNDTPSASISKTSLGLSKKHLETVKNSLRKVISDDSGTAKTLNNLKFKISGKTGTAQTKGKSHGWFIGFFPAGNSTYTICVFLENGGSSHYAVRVVSTFLKNVEKQKLLEL